MVHEALGSVHIIFKIHFLTVAQRQVEVVIRPEAFGKKGFQGFQFTKDQMFAVRRAPAIDRVIKEKT